MNLDRTVDWRGDENTGNAPVSGAMVQKFIKDTFNTKYGYVRLVGGVEQFFACEEDAGLYELPVYQIINLSFLKI